MKTFPSRSVTVAAALVAILSFAARAADSDAVYASDHFNPKISAWADGTLMAISADAGTFTIRGAKSPYGTATTRMLQEINEKTVKMGPEERATKTAEIRAAWADKLAKARVEVPAKDADFTFHLPGKENTLHVYDGTLRRTTRIPNEATRTGTTVTDNEASAMMAMKDLKIGDFVAVGYDDGVVYNDAYVLIKTFKVSNVDVIPAPSTRAAVASVPAKFVERRAVTNDDDTADRLRAAVENDKSLSPAARQVNISAKFGVVTLTGHVTNALEKDEIENKADATEGVRKVINDIEVSTK